MFKPKSLNKKRPPLANTLTIEQFEKCVDIDDFDKCDSCGQPIYNPNFYDEEMCGPCITGEASTIMADENTLPDKYWKNYNSL